MENSRAEQVTDPAEVEAVKAAIKAGEVVGEVYEDGEVWAVSASLQAWRNRKSETAATA